MPTCFVMMPISTPPEVVERYGGDEDHFLHVLEFLFTPALEKAGYEAISPLASGSDLIQAEIIKNLDGADLALCDMTTLNANVFFELGIRTALNKPVATVRDTLTERIPFDHAMVNCHPYRWEMDSWVVKEEIERLAAHIRAVEQRGGETNTLWKRLGIEVAAVGSAGTGKDDKIDHIVRELETLRTEVRAVARPAPAAPITTNLLGLGAKENPYGMYDAYAPAKKGLGFVTSTTAVATELHVSPSVEPAVAALLQQAWTIAGQIGAEFIAYRRVPDGVLIDFGTALVLDQQREAILGAGEEAGVPVEIVGGIFAPEPEGLRGARIAWPVPVGFLPR